MGFRGGEPKEVTPFITREPAQCRSRAARHLLLALTASCGDGWLLPVPCSVWMIASGRPSHHSILVLGL